MTMTTTSHYIENFPFPTPRPVQVDILKEIESAFASGYRNIILECPTGSGKSPIAIAAAMTLGSSYILVGSKELQDQYQRDFSWIMPMKGKNNFRCEIKDDFIRNGTFVCKSCGGLNRNQDLRLQACSHTSVDYGPCRDKGFDCKYKTRIEDYKVVGRGTKDEMVSLIADSEGRYRDAYSQWS